MASLYKILIKKSAGKQLEKLPKTEYIKINQAIFALSSNPRPANCLKLKGYQNYYRLRISVYRIIYNINDSSLTIDVIKIAHRRDVYNNL